jgi:hypothetical protein
MTAIRVSIEIDVLGEPYPVDCDVLGTVDCDGEVALDEAVVWEPKTVEPGDVVRILPPKRNAPTLKRTIRYGRPIFLSEDQRQAAEIALFQAWENHEGEL